MATSGTEEREEEMDGRRAAVLQRVHGAVAPERAALAALLARVSDERLRGRLADAANSLLLAGVEAAADT